MSRARLLSLGLILLAAPAWAHKPSDSYLNLKLEGDRVEGRWDIALRDLEYAMGLDRDGDERITWGEVKAALPEIQRQAIAGLQLQVDQQPCTLGLNGEGVVEHSDGNYAVLAVSGECQSSNASRLALQYDFFFEQDPQHRGLLQIRAGSEPHTAILSTSARRIDLEVAGPHRLAQTIEMLKSGVFHIWTGFDHLLFLVALLLPSVLRRAGNKWQPVEQFRPAFADVLKIVTAFTLAHSLTLTLAALQLIQLPSRLVESAIAASVILAAVNNLVPFMGRDRWLVAFALGLLHGFGFSGTLVDLQLSGGQLLTSVLGFNFGVELGQLAVLVVFVPIAFLVRQSFAYRRIVFVGGSVIAMLIASVWFAQRAFELAPL